MSPCSSCDKVEPGTVSTVLCNCRGVIPKYLSEIPSDTVFQFSDCESGVLFGNILYTYAGIVFKCTACSSAVVVVIVVVVWFRARWPPLVVTSFHSVTK